LLPEAETESGDVLGRLSLLTGSLGYRVGLRCRFFLHTRQQVDVLVNGESGLGTPETFGDDLRLDAGSKKVRRVRMPEGLN